MIYTYSGFHWRPLAQSAPGLVALALAFGLIFGAMSIGIEPLWVLWVMVFPLLPIWIVEYRATWTIEGDGFREQPERHSGLLALLPGRERFICWSDVKRFGFLGDGRVLPLMIKLDVFRQRPIIIFAPTNAIAFEAFDEFAFHVNETLRLKTAARQIPSREPYLRSASMVVGITAFLAVLASFQDADATAFAILAVIAALLGGWVAYGYFGRVRA